MMPCGIASRLHPPCLYFYLHALRIICMFFFLLNIGGVILLLTHRSTAVLFGGGMGSKRSLRSLASSHLNRQIQTGTEGQYSTAQCIATANRSKLNHCLMETKLNVLSISGLLANRRLPTQHGLHSFRPLLTCARSDVSVCCMLYDVCFP